MPEKGTTKDSVVIGGGSSDISTGDLLKIIPNVRDQMVTTLQKEVLQLRDELKKKQKKIDVLEKKTGMQFRDSLTGLYNQGFFLEEIPKRIPANEKRSKRPWSLLIVDIDHFKKVNDDTTYQCGNAILKNVAKKLQQISRDGDCVIRNGGDEFFIVSFSIDRIGFKILAERCRKSIENMITDYQGESFSTAISVTVSIGGCFVPQDSSMNLRAVEEFANGALHESKKHRNKITIFDDRRKDAENQKLQQTGNRRK